jgi:hypothetical protein
MENTFRIRVRINDKEAELSYALKQRDCTTYREGDGTLYNAVQAIKDIADKLSSIQE